MYNSQGCLLTKILKFFFKDWISFQVGIKVTEVVTWLIFFNVKEANLVNFAIAKQVKNFKVTHFSWNPDLNFKFY